MVASVSGHWPLLWRRCGAVQLSLPASSLPLRGTTPGLRLRGNTLSRREARQAVSVLSLASCWDGYGQTGTTGNDGPFVAHLGRKWPHSRKSLPTLRDIMGSIAYNLHPTDPLRVLRQIQLGCILEYSSRHRIVRDHHEAFSAVPTARSVRPCEERLAGLPRPISRHISRDRGGGGNAARHCRTWPARSTIALPDHRS